MFKKILLVVSVFICISLGLFQCQATGKKFTPTMKRLLLTEILKVNSLNQLKTQGKKLFQPMRPVPFDRTNTSVSDWNGNIEVPYQNFYFFFIDDEAKANWKHPVRYVFVNADSPTDWQLMSKSTQPELVSTVMNEQAKANPNTVKINHRLVEVTEPTQLLMSNKDSRDAKVLFVKKDRQYYNSATIQFVESSNKKQAEKLLNHYALRVIKYDNVLDTCEFRYNENPKDRSLQTINAKQAVDFLSELAKESTIKAVYPSPARVHDRSFRSYKTPGEVIVEFKFNTLQEQEASKVYISEIVKEFGGFLIASMMADTESVWMVLGYDTEKYMLKDVIKYLKKSDYVLHAYQNKSGEVELKKK